MAVSGRVEKGRGERARLSGGELDDHYTCTNTYLRRCEDSILSYKTGDKPVNLFQITPSSLCLIT